MNARQIIVAAFLIAACALTVQAAPAVSNDFADGRPQAVEEAQPASEPSQTPETNRAKRFYPLVGAYPAVSSVSAYSYLAPYANSVSAVHYPAPVVAAAPAFLHTAYGF